VIAGDGMPRAVIPAWNDGDFTVLQPGDRQQARHSRHAEKRGRSMQVMSAAIVIR